MKLQCIFILNHKYLKHNLCIINEGFYTIKIEYVTSFYFIILVLYCSKLFYFFIVKIINISKFLFFNQKSLLVIDTNTYNFN